MVANSNASSSTKTIGLLVALLIGGVLLVLIGCAALSLTPGVAGALQPSPTPPAYESWAEVQIAKPADAAEVMPTPTPFAPVEPTVTEPAVPTPTTEAASPEAASPEAASPEAPVAEAPTTDPNSQITMTIVDDGSRAPSEIPSEQPVYAGGKYILVRIGEQHLYAYQDDQLVFSFVASTGMGNSTRVGTFRVLDKIPNAYGSTWNIWMPDWMGIYWSGTLENGIHALPILPGGARLWAGFLGTPISYGCVVLGVDEAQQLYNWADIGTPVEIRY
jgi:lipoprotein-anchoring transpeptidase ErfK/SrfK